MWQKPLFDLGGPELVGTFAWAIAGVSLVLIRSPVLIPARTFNVRTVSRFNASFLIVFIDVLQARLSQSQVSNPRHRVAPDARMDDSRDTLNGNPR